MAMEKFTVGTITLMVLGIATVAVVAGLLATSRTISNNGNVKAVGVGVFWDSACTNETTSINWGMLEPNSSRSYSLYIRNNGTVQVLLSMSTGGWNPSSASSYLFLNWNCTGYGLSRNGLVSAYLTLTVASNATAITNFGFDITITGTEQA